MGAENLAIATMRAIANRPWLADAIGRFDKWGNPLGPDRYSYPYPIFERMRADGPVSYRWSYQQWFVIGHEEIKEVYASEHVSAAAVREVLWKVSPFPKLNESARAFFDNLLIMTDPPDHTRLRGLVSRAFTPRQVARIEGAVERLAARLVAEMLDAAGPDRGPVDVYHHFAGPLPINVICELLGIPEERWGWAGEISDSISKTGNTVVGFDPDEANRTFDELRGYVLTLAAERRAAPTDDLVSALVAVEEDGEALDDDELVAMVGLLMFAGHETTSGLIGNSLIALADHPAQRRLVLERPELWPNAVEELLRWDSPVQLTIRQAAADFEVAGRRIKRGKPIVLMPGAANRDPDFYEDPDVLRLDRPDPQPVSFGHGLHHCLGHALARMEAKVALRAFVEAFGDYTVERDRITWKRSIVTRGPIELPIRPGADSVAA